MVEHVSVPATVEQRGTRAAIFALGVLDPSPDAALLAVARLTDRLGGGATGIWLCDAVGWHHVAGALGAGSPSAAPPDPVDGEARAEVRLAGLVVGQVRATGVTDEVAAHAAEEVAEVLAARWERLRRGAHGEPVGVILADADLRILWCSDEFAEFHPAARGLVGRAALDIVNPEDVVTAAALLERHVGAGARPAPSPYPSASTESRWACSTCRATTCTSTPRSWPTPSCCARRRTPAASTRCSATRCGC